MIISTPGIYTPDQISAEAYHADPCIEPSLSRSVLVTLMDRSPRHAWLQHPRLNPSYEAVNKTAFDLGQAAHALLLQGEDVVTVIEADNYKTKAAQVARDVARDAGKVPLLPDQAVEVQAMIRAAKAQLQRHPDGKDAFSGKPEMTLACQDQEFGFWCRIRVDDLSNGVVWYDYKTTTDASPDAWERRAWDHSLHLQEAFYARIIEQVTSVLPKFRFVVQEIKPPYAIAIYEFDPMARQLAATRVREGMRRWHYCMTRNHWGGYTARVHTIETPPWIANRFESEKLREEIVEAETNKSLFAAALEFQAPHSEAAE
jgi:hypothetical protein